MICEQEQMDDITFWQEYSEAGYLTRPVNCDADDRVVYFTRDYKNIYTCNKSCPENSECNYEYECKCERGYQINPKAATCDEISCPLIKNIEEISNSECCDKFYGQWDGQHCVCAEDEYFNFKRCVPNGSFCSYKYTPEQISSAKSDCYYDYKAGSVGTTKSDCYYDYTSGSIGAAKSDCYYDYSQTNSVGMVSSDKVRGGCEDGYYCALAWSDEDCSVGLDETKRIYGVCSPKNERYTMCNRPMTVSSVSSDKARGGCEDGYYCALAWSDEDCSVGLDETKRIYGVCSPKDNRYTICNAKNTPPSVQVEEGCPDEYFCMLTWKDKQCNKITGDASVYYGTCEVSTAQSASACPVN